MSIICVKHSAPIRLQTKDPMIVHEEDGTYCSSQQFSTPVLDRSEALALLIVGIGRRTLEGLK